MLNGYRARTFALFAVIIGLGLTLGQAQIPDDPTGQDVLNCARSNLVEGTFHGTIRLELSRPDFTKTYVLEAWTEDGDKALIRIRKPENEAESGYLQRGDDLWFYDPEAGVPVSLPASALSEDFLGADLSLQDFYGGTLDESFNVELLGARDAGDKGDRGYQVRLVPKPEAPVVYGKIEIRVRESDCATTRMDYYDQRETLIRQAEFSQFETVGEGDSQRIFPLRMVFDDLTQEGSRTVERIEDYAFDIELPESVFTKACLASPDDCP